MALGLSAAILSVAAQADTFTIRKDTVVPAALDKELNVHNNRRGDRFSVTVRYNQDLPPNTQFVGRVTDVHKKKGDRPAYVDLEFTQMILPDGTRTNVRAVPISMDERYVTRDRDGRFKANKNVVKRDQYVVGGAVGGLVLGSIFKKPFEGTVLGALAGIALAENARNQNENVVLKKNEKIGVLFERDTRINWRGTYDSRDDRWDEQGRRNDDWSNDRRDDGQFGRRDDDRWNDDGYDSRYDDRDLRIEFEDRDLRFDRDETPYRSGGTIMVPLLSTARQLDLDVTESRNSDMILVESDDDMLKLKEDSDTFRFNGKRGNLPRSVERRDDVLYVPLEVLAKMTRQSIYVNGTKVDRLS